MKKVKILIAVVAVLVIIAIGGLVAVMMSMNSLIKTGVEKVGPQITGVPITMGEVSISPFSGAGELKGIVIGNPEGFKTKSAFELDHVRIKIDPKSIFSDTIIVEEVLIDGPRTTYEMGNGSSNIATIQKHIESKIPASEGGDDEPSDDDEDGPKKKIIINDLKIQNVKLGVSASFLGGKQLDLDMPDVHMTDIGKDKGGASPAEVLNSIFEQLTGTIKSVASSAGDLMNTTGDSLKGIGDDLKKTGDGVLDGVKGIFKSNK